MGTTTNHNLDKRLHQLIGDWIEEPLTTAASLPLHCLPR
ncbi:unnamed protein product, partial [marine sediment metagenome]